MEYCTVKANLGRITLEDCLELYYRKDIITKINDGKIVCFMKDGDS